MSRIVFFVANDLRRDARVSREAASLAADGHDVAVIGVLSPETDADERRDGYRILRAKAIRRPHRLWVRSGWLVLKRVEWETAYGRRRLGLRRFRRRVAEGGIAGMRRGVPRSPAALRQALGQASETAGKWAGWTWEIGKAAVVAPRAGACRIVDLATGGSADWLAAWWATWEGWAAQAVAIAPVAEVWAANDIFTIRAGLRAQRRHGGLIVYHVRDLVIDSGPYLQRPGWARASLTRLERRVIDRSRAVVTTTAAMADWLRVRYRPHAPIVVTHNCPARPGPEPAPRTGTLRSAAGVGPDVPVAMYAGGLRTGRGIEPFLDALMEPELAGVHGVLLGYGELEEPLKRRALEDRFGGRLHVVPAFPLDSYVSALADADVSLALFQPDTPSHRAVIPLKLFEALAVGVPVVASDTPGLRGVLFEDAAGRLGVVCDPTDPKAIAAAIASIVELPRQEADALRKRCHHAAYERWNWEREAERYLPLFRSGAAGAVGS